MDVCTSLDYCMDTARCFRFVDRTLHDDHFPDIAVLN